MYSLVLFNLQLARSLLYSVYCLLFSITFKGNGMQENSEYSLKQGKLVCGVKLDPLTQTKVEF